MTQETARRRISKSILYLLHDEHLKIKNNLKKEILFVKSIAFTKEIGGEAFMRIGHFLKPCLDARVTFVTVTFNIEYIKF